MCISGHQTTSCVLKLVYFSSLFPRGFLDAPQSLHIDQHLKSGRTCVCVFKVCIYVSNALEKSVSLLLILCSLCTELCPSYSAYNLVYYYYLFFFFYLFVSYFHIVPPDSRSRSSSFYKISL